ncbi:MAG: ThiF family adenylyltransferase [Candidatus Krumholzibacteriia bacterium]
MDAIPAHRIKCIEDADMPGPFPPRLTRTVDLYGPDGMARIRSAGVVVVGLGGVGAHAAVALARSGIGRLHLVDDDVITTSSLNRHPVAGPADLGRSKAEVLATFIAATCPETDATLAVARVTAASLPTLLPEAGREVHGVVIDAIDGVVEKIALIVHAAGQGRQVVCSAGAAGKVDPGLIRTGTLGQTRVCPLARKVRHGVRQAGLDAGAIAAVWSEEDPRPPIDAPPGTHLPDEPGVTRRQASNMMLPGMVGYALAALAVWVVANP